MPEKLTLTLDKKVIESAKEYAARNRTSLSRMVEHYFASLTAGDGSGMEALPPITRELTGIAGIETEATGRELLSKALQKRFNG